MKRFLLVLVLVALAAGGAYLAGYWPERGRRLQADQDVGRLQGELEQERSRLRVAELADEVFVALHHLSDRNFGLAREAVSRFFDGARGEAGRTPLPHLRSALEAALQRRDDVIAALSQGDPSTVGDLYRILEQLRQALGRPPLPALAGSGLPATPTPADTPSPGPFSRVPLASPYATAPPGTFATPPPTGAASPTPSPQP